MISDASDLSPRFCIKCLSFQRKAKARSYFCMTAGVNTTSASVSKTICSECFNVIELSSFGCKIQKPSLNIINLTRGWKLEVYPSFRVGIFFLEVYMLETVMELYDAMGASLMVSGQCQNIFHIFEDVSNIFLLCPLC